MLEVGSVRWHGSPEKIVLVLCISGKLLSAASLNKILLQMVVFSKNIQVFLCSKFEGSVR